MLLISRTGNTGIFLGWNTLKCLSGWRRFSGNNRWAGLVTAVSPTSGTSYWCPLSQPLCLHRAATSQSYWEKINSARRTHRVFSLLWSSRRCFLLQLLEDFCTGTVLCAQSIWSACVISFPTNYPPVLISKEKKMTECKYSTAKMQITVSLTFFPSWSSSAGLCSKLVLTLSTAQIGFHFIHSPNWFSLYPQPKSIPWGQSLQEEGWERLSHCWTHQPSVLCHMKWIKLVPKELSLKMPEVQLIC